MNPIRNAIVPITKRDLVSCKRCGCTDLAWVKFKSGKSGLVETAVTRPFWRGNGPAPEGLWALKFNFHNCDEYRKLQTEIQLRASMCHPKADKPREILADAISHVIHTTLNEIGPAGFAKLTMENTEMQAIELLSRLAGQIQEVK